MLFIHCWSLCWSLKELQPRMLIVRNLWTRNNTVSIHPFLDPLSCFPLLLCKLKRCDFYIREGDCYITTEIALASVRVFNPKLQPSPFPQFDPKYKPYPNQGWKSPSSQGARRRVNSPEEGTKGSYQLKWKHTHPLITHTLHLLMLLYCDALGPAEPQLWDLSFPFIDPESPSIPTGLLSVLTSGSNLPQRADWSES